MTEPTPSIESPALIDSASRRLHPFCKYGFSLFVLFAALHFFAIDLFWNGGRSTTSAVGHYGSLMNALDHFMWLAVGIALIGFWQSRDTFRLSVKDHRLPVGIREFELADFQRWVAADFSRKYLNPKAQVSAYRQQQQS
jgi:hypothetical protein